ncbi:MAG: response regulator [Planctomycetes bacterium]|nr:response regulator [Planctomycetota bacterium]
MTSEAETARNILVVDDELNIRKLIRNVLSKIPGFVVETASDGTEAVEFLESNNYNVNLIITDMQMPRMNGLELIKEVLKDHPTIPIVVLTAHKNDRNVIECLEQGSVEYLTKPISVDKLQQVVKRVLDRHARFEGAGEKIEVKSEVKGWIEITAPTDFEYVERFQKFTALLGSLPINDEVREDIRVAVDELGQNAVEWGNRNNRTKRIHLSYCVFKDRIVFKIEDEGEGFDPEQLRDPSVDPLAHIMERMKEGKRAGGYGVFITGKLMDDITYSERGNVVVMTKIFKK